MNETKTFAQWCIAKKLTEDQAAVLAAAAGVDPGTELTKEAFSKFVDGQKSTGNKSAARIPQTVGDWFKQKKVLVADRQPFCEKFNLTMDTPIAKAKFEKLLKQFKQTRESSSQSSQEDTTTKPLVFTPVSCSLKYRRKYLLPGDESDLVDLDDAERAALLAAGKIKIVSK